MIQFTPTTILQHVKNFFVAAMMALLVLVPTAGFADDWVAEQLRGRVFMFDNGEWKALERGDVISDDRYIRTTGGGRVTFVRGNESIEVSNQTQIRILDANGTKYTTVMQDFGTVGIEAEVEQVQHFSVVTPFLAAVVKGTQFTVTVSENDSEVSVNRGLVQVRDTQNRVMTNVRPGQRANVQRGRKMEVQGRGPKEPMTTFDGEEMSDSEVDDAVAKANGNNGNGNGNSGNNGNGNGNSGNNGNGNGNS
ncbi:FecR family protein, partial [bacterium]|nr:FecR family protein [bacterium]MDB2384123.1 FecR family protein [bacterium]